MLSTKPYLDFDLLIEKTGEGYRARVLNSPAGQAVHEFALPFSDLEIENFVLRLTQSRTGMRRIDSPGMETAKQFGGRLFSTVFAGDIRSCLQSSLNDAERQQVGLRLRLRLSATPELVDLPWEFIYNATLNRFFSLSVDSPVVRYLDLPERIETLAITPPLRVLVMIASPRDYPALDVEKEWQQLKSAVADVEKRGLLVLERLATPTLSALQKQLRRTVYHVFHFIGHGGFDQQAQDGLLVLEDEQGNSRTISGQYLGMLLHDEKSLRLALLNACEGGRTSRSDPFAGVCQSLLQQGIPAVIAMQFAITDQAAITLAHEFYLALAEGMGVEAALTEARKGIFASNNEVEWGTPVLYLRAPDGRIFDLTESSIPPTRPIQPIAPTGRPWWKPAALLLVLGLLIGGTIWLWPKLARVGEANPGNISSTAPTATVLANSAATQTPESVSVSAATETPTLAPVHENFTRVYTHAFEDGNLRPWDDNDAWRVVDDGTGNHVYQVQAPADADIASDPPENDAMHPWRDYAVEFRMRIVQASTSEDLFDTWISLRQGVNNQTPECESLNNFYLDVRRHTAVISTNDNCKYKELGQTDYPFQLNTWYTIRVEAIGTHLTLSIDGQPILERDDPMSGQGFYYLNAAPSAIVQFDDIFVERYNSP